MNSQPGSTGAPARETRLGLAYNLLGDAINLPHMVVIQINRCDLSKGAGNRWRVQFLMPRCVASQIEILCLHSLGQTGGLRVGLGMGCTVGALMGTGVGQLEKLLVLVLYLSELHAHEL